MILQALCDYYERKRKDDPDSVPPVGYEDNAISYVVVIDEEGRFVNFKDVRIVDGRKRYGRPERLPLSQDRTGKNSWETAFLLWDHPRYVFGIPQEGDAKGLAEKRLASFRSRISAAFPDPAVDSGVHAVSRFLDSPDQIAKAKRHELWNEMADGKGNVSFQLRDNPDLVCQSDTVVATVQAHFRSDCETEKGICLVSGETDVAIERLHAATPLPTPASKSTAKLHSFNLDAFRSFRKEKGGNAPVGRQAAFGYTTALNHLLRRGSSQKLQIGDATTIFWANRENNFENDFAVLFNESTTDNPDAGTRAVAALVAAVEQGVDQQFDSQTRFFVLGLAPNAARIAIRFWYSGTVAEMAVRIARHFEDIRIDPPRNTQKEPPFLSIRLLLRSIAATSSKWPEGDPEKVPPNLGGEVMRAILEGLPYPETLFHGAIRRIRAGAGVTYPRAAILKACLNRKRNSTEEKIQMSLDSGNTNPGYRLGRLFAVLERIQEEAAGGHGKLNATIRDRFYGAASSTPATVFPMLLRLKNHHLSKIDNVGRRKNLESLLGEIIDGLPPRFEPHLSMDNQGRFAVGYYHQRMHPSTYGKQGD